MKVKKITENLIKKYICISYKQSSVYLSKIDYQINVLILPAHNISFTTFNSLKSTPKRSLVCEIFDLIQRPMILKT